MKRLTPFLLGMMLVTLTGCSEPPSIDPQQNNQSAATSNAPSIGTAKMRTDGTIEMQLRAETESGYGDGKGIKGDALITYAPGDAHYDEVLKHLGGLKKGETKPVPPWPEKKE
ncbi:hypothetical protein DES53_1026 [Roseimicrobium gellanilyticum]|uniref:Uncharacterized protein n=1 Tax=Roseimicrobium gellanilyticum TaxID=748857 RepID=A0A366HRS0_9BACT|nr:hypothetical protein [Roseimicrobium gellanilyticum]RBP45624.1 hypothetical protein DES53_1026 [Roseimicrobium gellanilyticum]